ncbi:hypothetical protein [Algicola sagamiensis]|uniref:hypothetical protein n=1 Tax=Algicola sagamiensis TaxID=163869 RepID=UPI0003694648|nr:hypothetical protein [Algicola sagamiensis]
MEKGHIKINEWNKGEPSAPGAYFVAYKIGLAGFYDIMLWDGEKWLKSHPDWDVIAFIEAIKLRDYLNIDWPEPESEELYPKSDGEYLKKEKEKYGEDPWVLDED